MKKTPITIVSTDWHLKQSNIESIKDLVREKCELAKLFKIQQVFCLGDIFESRTGQQQDILVAFSEILSIFKEYQIQLIAIAGNHDKTQYLSTDSFLLPYKHHPCFIYIDTIDCVTLGNDKEIFNVHLIPYFRESLWLEKYQEFMQSKPCEDKEEKNILFSHIAMNGSVNNDGSKVSCNISVGDFKEWDLVLLGHYHNQQQLASNIFHIPSIQQNNFGEDNQKGFTIVYDDCSTELVLSTFKEYEKVKIDIDNTSKSQLNELIKKYSHSKNFVRFEFIGSSDNVKSIDKEELAALGIGTTMKIKEVEKTIEFAELEIKNYNKSNIVDEFKVFCKEKEKDFEQGVKYLTKKLN